MRALALVVLLWSLIAAPAAAQPRVDGLGDPLPPSAVARLGTTRLRHVGLGGAAFSPDGKTLVTTAYSDTPLRIWDAATGKPLLAPAVPPRSEQRLPVYSPDGNLLATAQGDAIVLWDPAAGKQKQTLTGHTRPPLALAWADGGKVLVSVAQDNTVRWWDPATGKEQRVWKPFGDEVKKFNDGERTKSFSETALSADGTTLAVAVWWRHDTAGGGREGTIVVFDLATGKERCRFEGDTQLRFHLALSADGSRLAAHLKEREVSVYKVAGGERLAVQTFPYYDWPFGTLFDVALSPDGSQVAVAGCKMDVVIWRTEDPKKKVRLATRPAEHMGISMRRVHFSPDGKRLLVETESCLQLFDAASGKPVPDHPGHRCPVGAVAFQADGRELLTASESFVGDPPLELAAWDAATWKPLRFSLLPPDGRVYDHGSGGPPKIVAPYHTVCLDVDWYGKSPTAGEFVDLAGKSLGKLQVKDPERWRRGQFSPTGKVYLAADDDSADRSCRLFAVPSGKHLATVPRASAYVFSADEQKVALLSPGRPTPVYDVATGKRLWELGTQMPSGPNDKDRPPFVAGAFSADGKLLATWEAARPGVKVWDLRTGKLLWTLENNARTKWLRQVVALAFSPDGRTLATGGIAAEYRIEVWELATGKLRCRLAGHDGAVQSLAWAPDGRHLVSGSADSTALVWDVFGPTN
jgi:WD40 repeat protein